MVCSIVTKLIYIYIIGLNQVLTRRIVDK